VDGTLQILRQLQGLRNFGRGLGSQILPRRIASYTPELLDQLCRRVKSCGADYRRIPLLSAKILAREPTVSLPITILLREMPSGCWRKRVGGSRGKKNLFPTRPRILEALKKRGASFFAELARSTGRLPSESGGRAVGAGDRRAGNRRWIENLRSLVIPNAVAERARAAPHGPGMLPDVGFVAAVPHSRRFERGFFANQLLLRGAWCFANCWRASSGGRYGASAGDPAAPGLHERETRGPAGSDSAD